MTGLKQKAVPLAFFKLMVVLDPADTRTSDRLVAWEKLFSELKMPFKIVTSSKEVTNLMDGERFDLLMLPYSPAGALGSAALTAVRSADASYRNIPVLGFVQESGGLPADLSQAGVMTPTSGMDDLLVLPSDSAKEEQALLHKLQAWANKVFEALPVLQESSIDKIRVFDDEEQTLLNSLFQIYTESTGAELQEMPALVQGQDFDGLRKKAHKLKSSAAQLGAFRFEKYCNLMEYDSALTQEKAQKLYEEMNSEYQQSLAEFKSYCEKYAQA